ncbi:YolD-like family protein [Sporosarcina sp. JAI121]|uniref:YolD-like family protein n=1 Tax=Sporosarcina sp. JAI121 TaxID=2723064 RepID=UPI0015C82803|nr:YolD-like family protein [Sporosarcina sp. JAI121]NYF23409.1 hypothetical protein [Sporosarcina sp. JAI121]
MLENNRDRGTKKWAMSMILPEHLVELRNWMEKEHYEERPELSEWDLQAIQEEIEVAYKRKCQTLIKTWKDGKIMTRGAIIEIIDVHSRCVVLDDPFGLERIPISDIVGVQCME